MTNAYCISGLARKRADLAAELHELEQRANQLRAGIAHLDAVLDMMEPGRPKEPRSRQYRPEWFGNLGRLVLDALRDTPEPMTSMQVAAAVMALCGLETTDRAMQAVVERRVAASLNRRIGLVEKVPCGAQGVVWRIADSRGATAGPARRRRRSQRSQKRVTPRPRHKRLQWPQASRTARECRNPMHLLGFQRHQGKIGDGALNLWLRIGEEEQP